MSFVDTIHDRLAGMGGCVAVREVHAGEPVEAAAGGLLERVRSGRAFLRERGVVRGDRVVLIAANSIDWIALDLAVMSEGAVCVPMYVRQAPADLRTMIADCQPALVVCDDAIGLYPDDDRRVAPVPGATPAPVVAPADVFASDPVSEGDRPVALADDDLVTIIYTSGTSGAAKGVMLTAGNVGHMLACTTKRIGELLADVRGRACIFHYLPFCFCGSWILLLTALSRGSLLSLSMNLERLRDEIAETQPHFFMNVPTFLERVARGVREKVERRGGVAAMVLNRARRAVDQPLPRSTVDRFNLWLADRLIFRTVRSALSPRLAGLVCGSAPLSEQTQRFFEMLGIGVLQVYGLTETTAICTMDRVGGSRPGCVGHPIDGIEMTLGEHDEILVKGPNIFQGYWNKPRETEAVLTGGWFHTGDRGQVTDDGNWRIVGRIKNLIVLNSGHNIAPEPLERKLLAAIDGAGQVLLVGHGRSFLTAIITGNVSAPDVQAALDRVNIALAHYKRIHGFYIHREPFSADAGLVTANGKLRRDAIIAHCADAIEDMYRRRAS